MIAHINGEETSPKSNERTENNERIMLQSQFKEITSHLQYATLVHATGTGQVQEQFVHYLVETQQFKNTKTAESTQRG